MLYIVSTPIGNLKDATLRAVDVFKKADLILTEDTRSAGKFLKKFGISHKPFLSFFEHNEKKRVPQIVVRLKDGQDIALISRAGTPLVSDPGYRLVQACIKEGINFTSIPGPSAVINALILSGLPTDSFIFLGFLPQKKSKRKQKLERAGRAEATIILFENPKKVVITLKQIKEVLGDRECCIVREMTKVHEETLRGKISEVISQIAERDIKGECTLVIGRM